MKEGAKFTYSSLEKAFKKQTKTIKNQTRKKVKAFQSLNSKQQLKSVEDLSPKNLSNIEAKDEIDQIKIIEQETIREKIIHKTFNKKEIKLMIFKSLFNYNIFWKRNL